MRRFSSPNGWVVAPVQYTRRIDRLRWNERATRALAELVGTAGLVTAVIGSGIAASRLSPSDVGLQLLESALATGAALAVLIAVLAPVSGAHLNPAVTLFARITRAIGTGDAVAYVAAQITGGVLGAVLANVMFSRPVVELATQRRGGFGILLAEVVATAGLLVVIFGLIRSGKPGWVAGCVGAYIGAAYFFTSSTSFANPAATIGRTLSDSFSGIAPGSVPAFLGAQLVGMVVSLALVAVLYPPEPPVAGQVSVNSALTAGGNREQPRSA